MAAVVLRHWGGAKIHSRLSSFDVILHFPPWQYSLTHDSHGREVTFTYYVLVHVLAEAVQAYATGTRQFPAGSWGPLQTHHDQVYALPGRQSQSEHDVPRRRQGVPRLPHGPWPDDARRLVQPWLRKRRNQRGGQRDVTPRSSSRYPCVSVSWPGRGVGRLSVSVNPSRRFRAPRVDTPSRLVFLELTFDVNRVPSSRGIIHNRN